MLIPQQISIITVLFLAHCTLIVRSVSLTRSVSSESSSSNVNKTDKFVTLVDSKAKNTDSSQLSEARSLRSFSSKREVRNAIEQWKFGLSMLFYGPWILLRLLPPVQIIEEVLKYNRPELDAIDYFNSRLRMYLENRNKNCVICR
ncbi:uncharacterized protein LOC112539042 [Tetranychus urticae]|uniref:uncharacterized protein LOC112539042 n=1 Tax=Tetranychus urticae TaxID=32264 RepID=UPI000D643DA6|nr:uncharacterized protein LOC112539042 [Tetranychus urticae]